MYLLHHNSWTEFGWTFNILWINPQKWNTNDTLNIQNSDAKVLFSVPPPPLHSSLRLCRATNAVRQEIDSFGVPSFSFGFAPDINKTPHCQCHYGGRTWNFSKVKQLDPKCTGTPKQFFSDFPAALCRECTLLAYACGNDDQSWFKHLESHQFQTPGSDLPSAQVVTVVRIGRCRYDS